MTPALNSNYEVYKSASHTLLQLAVLVTPFLENTNATAWHGSFNIYLTKVDVAITALHNSKGTLLKKELLLSMLGTVSTFLRSCLEKSKVDRKEWEELNKSNFWRVKECMLLATKEQADANVRALLKWKNRLGPELWRDIYVIIPTVWPVARTNPRLEIFRNLLDEDRIETHIFCSEYPRTLEEARTLLGRIVGDRAIGRKVFGVDCHMMRMKVVALSTQVDVVNDDAISNLHSALRDNGWEPRKYATSTSGDTGAGLTSYEDRELLKCPMATPIKDKVKQEGNGPIDLRAIGQ